METEDEDIIAEKPKSIREKPCIKCGAMAREWKAWGSYLDKDLICLKCGHVIDIWGC